MTIEEAKKIARIIGQVDGGCSSCIRSALVQLMFCFSEIDWRSLVKEEAHEDVYWRSEDWSGLIPDDPYDE